MAFWKICCDRYTYYPGADKWLIFAGGPLLLFPLASLAAHFLVLVRPTAPLPVPRLLALLLACGPASPGAP